MCSVENLRMYIDIESVCIWTIGSPENEKDVVHLYWHKDDFEEDGDSALSMANALHLYYTNPQELITLFKGV